METIIDALQDVVTTEREAEVQSELTQPDDATIETQLAQEIRTLWSEHVRLSASRKATSREMRQIRASLAERLHAMKSLLSRPGRGGQWRSWLRERAVPRSTADRLVSRFAETLGIENGNVPTEAIPSSPEDSAEKLAKSVWQRVGKFLSTCEQVVRFIGCIAEISGVGHEQRAEGLVIFRPIPEAAEGVPASAPATGPAPQPSAIEEPAAEATATPTEAEQAPAVADAGSGAVV